MGYRKRRMTNGNDNYKRRRDTTYGIVQRHILYAGNLILLHRVSSDCEGAGAMMNLYLVSRSTYDYDEYNGFVIAAESPKQALEYLDKKHRHDWQYSDWPDEGEKTAELIGTTDKYTETTVILGSYNAG